MRIFVVTAVLVFLLSSSEGLASVTVVDEDESGLTIEVRPGVTLDGNPATGGTGEERFLVVLPAMGAPRVRLDDAVFEDRRGVPPRAALTEIPPGSTGLYPTQPFAVSNPGMFRRAAVATITCYDMQVDIAARMHRVWKRYRLRIDYDSSFASDPLSDPLVRSAVINHPRAPRLAAAPSARRVATPDPHFSLSSNWATMSIAAPGIYVIEGQDLANVGINLASINDPNSFRLFTGGGEQLSMDMSGDGTYRPGNWMNECDILVEYGGDGSFDPSDRILFYAVGTPGWKDLYEPGAPRDEFTDHLYVTRNKYYLTWDDIPGFSGAPSRMTQTLAAPIAAPDLTTFEERMYFETDRIRNLTFGGDGWLWAEVPQRTGPELYPLGVQFTATGLDTTQPQTFRTLALAKREINNVNHHAVYRLGPYQDARDPIVAEQVWSTPSPFFYEQGVPVVASGFFLSESVPVSLTLDIPRDLNPNDFMYFAWFSIFYHRHLHAQNDALFFSVPDTTGTVNLAVSAFGTAGAIYLFDVTDPFHPRQLTGFAEATGAERSIRFSTPVAGVHRYFWAGTEGTMTARKPIDLIRYFPVDLRNTTNPPHMVIVTHPTFLGAASLLKQYRESSLPPYANPVIELVTTTEVFDNFSGGLVDPMAIRNYCKFLYDNFTDGSGAPLLSYLALIGDANKDFRNIASPQPNLVTTNVNMDFFDANQEAYVTDDFFAYLDSTDTISRAFLDIAVGRLPAATLQDAQLLVNRVIDYEVSADLDTWRDRVLLVADDENSKLNTQQGDFVLQSEILAHLSLAPYIDSQKIYLTEFPAVGGGIKPGARLAFVDAWNNGALIIHYDGHGSSTILADEQVFVEEDIGNLRNASRLPLFIAMSCTVGDFAESVKSLSERLLLKDAGGAVGTLSATELTTISQNHILGQQFLGRVIAAVPGAAPTVGLALVDAKNATNTSRSWQENSEKYGLLCDPALRLLAPRRSIEFSSINKDTLVAGRRETIRGTVMDNGSADLGFNGTVSLTVREPDDLSGYSKPGFQLNYRYPGGVMYRGTANVVAGQFEFSFTVPRSVREGVLGFSRAYAEDGTTDAVALDYDIVFRAPTLADTTALAPSDGPPRVVMGFRNGQIKVKPGAVIVADIHDADGINILNTTPEGKLALVFDNAGFGPDVTEFFEFSYGGVDTSGTLSFPLPDLDVGGHRVVLKVSDTFGQTTLDTLGFVVTDPLDYSAEIVFNYPNPFKSSTYFVMNLTDPAAVQLDIFTVSGDKIRSIRSSEDPGQQMILWDGRDFAGSSIANGTYLYVARVSFVGLDRPPLVLRGKLVKIE